MKIFNPTQPLQLKRATRYDIHRSAFTFRTTLAATQLCAILTAVKNRSSGELNEFTNRHNDMFDNRCRSARPTKSPQRPLRKPAPSLASDATILILGCDYATSRRLAELVRSTGYRTITFESAVDLLNSTHLHPPCCVLMERSSAQPNGLDFQREFARSFEFIPIIILSEDSSLKMGIAAMKAGAIDYIVQPADPEAIADAIKTALAKQAKSCEFNNCSLKFRQGWQKLTIREREVLSFIIDGFLNKQIAAELGISEKTIKVHRGRVMKKMQVASFAELVRLAERASIAQKLSDERFTPRSKSSVNGDRQLDPSTAHGEPAPNCSL